MQTLYTSVNLTAPGSKLTFSKSHLLGTFYCKMVTIGKNVKGRTLHVILHEGLMHPNVTFSTLHFATVSLRIPVEFLSERQGGERERQVMPQLVLLIKFVLFLTTFQVSFSFNLLVAIWRLSPKVWPPNIFSTRHGDQNGRSLERCCNYKTFR